MRLTNFSTPSWEYELGRRTDLCKAQVQPDTLSAMDFEIK